MPFFATVVTYLPPFLRPSLAAAVSDISTVCNATDLSDLQRLLVIYPDAIVIFDPEMIAANEMGCLYRVLEIHPAELVIAYFSKLHAQGARTLLQLTSGRIHHLTLHGYDGSTTKDLRQAVVHASNKALAAEYLRAAAPVLSRLPSYARCAVEQFFLVPPAVRDRNRLALDAHTPTRTFYEVLTRAGLVPAGQLMDLTRVLRVYQHVRREHLSLKQIACPLEYPSPRALRYAFHHITGWAPSVITKTCSHDTVMDILVQSLRRRPGPARPKQSSPLLSF